MWLVPRIPLPKEYPWWGFESGNLGLSLVPYPLYHDSELYFCLPYDMWKALRYVEGPCQKGRRGRDSVWKFIAVSPIPMGYVRGFWIYLRFNKIDAIILKRERRSISIKIYSTVILKFKIFSKFYFSYLSNPGTWCMLRRANLQRTEHTQKH